MKWLHWSWLKGSSRKRNSAVAARQARLGVESLEGRATPVGLFTAAVLLGGAVLASPTQTSISGLNDDSV